jgi:hypothetical protein
MNNIIIYSDESIIKILIPCTTDLTLLKIGEKDIPKNIPFWIIKESEIPNTPQETWNLVDMGKPSGYGEKI